MPKPNSRTNKISPEFKAGSKQRSEVICLPFSFFFHLSERYIHVPQAIYKVSLLTLPTFALSCTPHFNKPIKF